jgi:hypothetical protein
LGAARQFGAVAAWGDKSTQAEAKMRPILHIILIILVVRALPPAVQHRLS